MISAVLFVNQKGEIIISRTYRDDISRGAAEAFRMQVVAAKESGTPIVKLGEEQFLYIRHGTIWVAAITTRNANAALILQYLKQLVTVFLVRFLPSKVCNANRSPHAHFRRSLRCVASLTLAGGSTRMLFGTTLFSSMRCVWRTTLASHALRACCPACSSSPPIFFFPSFQLKC